MQVASDEGATPVILDAGKGSRKLTGNYVRVILTRMWL